MSAINTTIKIDPILKEQSQTLFESLGLNLSSAINIFLRKRYESKPFHSGWAVHSLTQRQYRPSWMPKMELVSVKVSTLSKH